MVEWRLCPWPGKSVHPPLPNQALTDGEAVSHWRAPEGMTATVHTFDPRCGGAFRISLSYDNKSRAGKTAGNVDTYHGYFREGSLESLTSGPTSGLPREDCRG